MLTTALLTFMSSGIWHSVVWRQRHIPEDLNLHVKLLYEYIYSYASVKLRK
jgi:hypothetical protein